MRERKKDRRAFWLSFSIALFVFLTVAGMLLVDYEGRKLSFGDSTPMARVERQGERARLRIKAFGQEKTWDVTKVEQALEFLREFACLPPKWEG